MATPPSPDPLAAADRLAAALGGVEAGLREAIEQGLADSRDRDEQLAKYGRRNRILILVAVVGLLLDMTATAVAVTAYLASRHNTATVLQVHDANLAGCQANNVRLAKQEKALHEILGAALPPPTASAAQQQAAAAFLAKANGFIASGWAPRQCQVAYPNPNGH
jgi:hypothetical protein